MFDQLMDLVKKHSGNAIVSNPAIPNEKNEEVMADASQSITSGLQNMLASGNVKEILQMFAGKGNASTSVNSRLSGGFMQDLMNKFGLNQQDASQVAENVVPGVMNEMVQKTNDPSDKSFDIQGIFNSLSGGKLAGVNMQEILTKLKGTNFDIDGDGDTDLQDLMALVKGGGAGGKGIMDTVKGLFK